MSSEKLIQYQQSVFSSFMLLSTQMETHLDRALSPVGLTSVQWFMSIFIETSFEHPPTLKEAARLMGTSYQNIKQIALNLQKRGLIEVRKDPKDARVTRLHMSTEQAAIWEKADELGAAYLEELFANVSETELKNLKSVLLKIKSNILVK